MNARTQSSRLGCRDGDDARVTVHKAGGRLQQGSYDPTHRVSEHETPHDEVRKEGARNMPHEVRGGEAYDALDAVPV